MSTPHIFPEATLQFEHVEARRGSTFLFSDLSFTLNPWDILWIQGENGIGKTTLLRIAASLTRPTEGHVGYTLGDMSASAFDCMAYQGHQDGFKASLNAQEALTFWAKMYNYNKPLGDVFERVTLSDRRFVSVAQLSAGQKRRLALARLIISQKPIWIMDEPGAAMDKAGVTLIEQLIIEHSQAGGSALIATHSSAKTLSANSRRLVLQAA